MECKHLERHLSNLSSGRELERVLDILETHVKECDACRGEIKEEQIDNLLEKVLSPIPVQEDFVTSVMAMASIVPSPKERLVKRENALRFLKRVAIFICLSITYILYVLLSYSRTHDISMIPHQLVQMFYIVNIIMGVSGLFMFFCYNEAVKIDSWIAGKLLRRTFHITIPDYAFMRVCGIGFFGATFLLPFLLKLF